MKISYLIVVLFINSILATANPGDHISASKSVGCIPLEVSFTAHLNNVKNYHWNLGNGTISYLPNPTAVYNQSGYFDISLIVEYNNHELDTIVYERFIHTVEKPVIEFSVSDSVLCYIKEINFFSNVQGATSYLWEFGDGNTSDKANPAHIYKLPGTYDISLTTFNEYGCGAAFVKENYIKIDIPDFTASKLVSCEKEENIVFSSTTDFKNYTWNFGDGQQSNDPKPHHIYQEAGFYDVSLTIEDAQGCITNVTKSKFIEVNPQTEISISISDSIICRNDAVSFSQDLKKAHSIFWNLSDGFNTSDSNFEHQFDQTGTYDLEVILKNQYGCISKRKYTSIVQVVEPVKPDIFISTYEGCAPLEISMRNQTNSAEEFSWQIGKDKLYGREQKYTFYQSGEYTITSKTTLENGCKVEYQLEQKIEVHNSNNSIQVTELEGCIPMHAEFSLANQNVTEVKWDFQNGHLSENLSEEVEFSLPGNYLVSVSFTDQFGCKKSLKLEKPIIAYDTLLTFKKPPAINVCTYSEVEFNGAMGYEFWSWNFGDGQNSNQKNPRHIYANPGSYTVSLTTKNQYGCKTTIPEYNQINYSVFDTRIEYSVIEALECPTYTMQFEAMLNHGQKINWKFDDGVSSNQFKPIHTFYGNGERNIQLTVTDSSSGCTLSKAVIVQPPWPYCVEDGKKETEKEDLRTITRHTISSCTAPYEVIFSNPWPEAKKVKWDFGDGHKSSESEPKHIFQSPGIYQVSYSAIFGDGKSDVIQNYVTVEVYNPEVDFTYLTRTGCNGINLQFEPVNSDVTDWKWSFNDGTISWDKNTNKLYSNDHIDQVKLEAIDKKGCKASAVKNIIVGNPYLQIEVDENICLGDTIQVIHNIEGFASYQWNWGDGRVTKQKQPYYHYQNPGKFAITLEVTDYEGCKSNYPVEHPVIVNHPQANFEVKGSVYGCNNLQVEFVNKSSDADQWLWDFGNHHTSNAKNPKFNFSTGTYSIKLSAYKNGCMNSMIRENFIQIDSIKADFLVNQNDNCLPSTILFQDRSYQAEKWLWDFGDGITSNQKDISHVFNSFPQRPVKLTIFNKRGCSAEAIKEVKFFKSDFSVSDDKGCYPFKVEFNEQAPDAVSWHWDFGDGNHSTQSNPVHYYEQEGKFDVALTVNSKDGCSQKMVKEKYIEVKHIKATFQAQADESICAPLLVNFINQSQGENEYLWEFGDGKTSHQKDPFHIYNDVGEFDVKLKIINDIGCVDSIESENLVKTHGPLTDFTLSDTKVCYPEIIQFNDQSASAINWSWHFGDGNFSDQQNPVHTYDKPGMYQVTLISKDANECQQIKTLDSLWVYPVPEALFEVEYHSNCQPVEVKIKNQSKNLMQEKYFWHFDNGSVSDEFEPSITFSEPGNYAIDLKVVNGSTCSNSIKIKDEIIVIDTFNLKEPLISEVSVSDDQAIVFLAEPYTRNNLKYHILYKRTQPDQEFYLEDTIYNHLDKFYVDKKVFPGQESYSYKLQTHTFCNTPAPLAQLTEYQTINLNLSNQNNFVNLYWNHYIGHQFNNYAVQRKQDNGSWQIIANPDVAVNSYLDPYELCPDQYDYRIIAEKLGGKNFSSISNISRTEINTDYTKQTVEVIKATVLPENKTLVEWKNPDFGVDNILFYELYRAKNDDEQKYEMINKVSGKLNSYVDEHLEVSENFYTYYLKVVNSCNINTDKSNLGTTILLQKDTQYYNNKLFWNTYSGWNEGVSEYILQKKDKYGNWNTIKKLKDSESSIEIDL